MIKLTDQVLAHDHYALRHLLITGIVTGILQNHQPARTNPLTDPPSTTDK